jgi:hypothetical protein
MAHQQHPTTDGAAAPLDILRQSDDLRESDYWKEYVTRLENGRDMHTVITAASETGVGKTTLAFTLCMLGDMSGWSIEQATLDPAEYAFLYDSKLHCDDHDDETDLRTFERCSECEYELKPGSWLLADEWEQAVDARNSMSKENREASHQVATKRYRQIFAVYTAPSLSWIDNRFSQDAIDYWLQAQEGPDGEPKGEAEVYRMEENEHLGKAYHKSPDETISWPVMDHHREFRKLERLKKKRMEDSIQRTYIHRDEFEEAKKNFWNKATQKTRYHIVKALAEDGSLSQTKIADILQKAEHVEGLSQQRVSQLVNTDEFEDAYKG